MRSLYMAVLATFAGLGFALGQSNETRVLQKEIRLSTSIVGSQVLQPVSFAQAPIPEKDVFNQRYFRLVRFEKVLRKKQRMALSSNGVEVEGYVPYNSYLLSFPLDFHRSQLATLGALEVISLSAENKLSKGISKSLRLNEWQAGETVNLLVQCYLSVNQSLLESDLKAMTSLSKYGNHKRTYALTVLAGQIPMLAAKPYVKFIELSPGIPVPDDTKGRSLHRSNAINTDYLGGLKYDGKGVSVAIADDGHIGPHIDLRGRLTSFTQSNSGTHGDMTSGICVGAANLDPRYKGMASGAYLYMYDIGGYPQINNAIANYNTYGTVIASTSYSQGCNAYTSDSEDGDLQLFENKPLMFVFSAGNNATADCGYGAGAGWGNITGGYKNGKNVIATGNVGSNGVIDPTSSKGPAPDGRIKPDICANGLGQMSTNENYTYQVGGGTSAASPGLAGVTAQLYQAWRELKSEPNPEGALIKAILMNTADDLGKTGPDFTYGWGQVNALKALRTIQENRYVTRTANDGDTIDFDIPVPEGSQNLKVMIYWADPAGVPLSDVNLVNNLDLTVRKPDGTLAFPWKLKTNPVASALSAAASNGIDSLNNMEQVSLNGPAAGVYTVKVKGSSVPEGPQKFYIVYQIENSGVQVTYPIGGEGFVPGETEVLRWDAFGTTAPFTVSYSVDSGQTWTTLAAPSATLRQQNLTVPNLPTGRALVKVSRGTESDISDHTFSIVGVPTNLQVVSGCVDTLHLAWSAVTGASGYEVSKLGSKYMDSVGTTTTTQIRIPYSVFDSVWYSVRAIFPNGNKGRRAIAKMKLPGLSNCVFNVDAHMARSLSPTKGVAYNCSDFANYKVKVMLKNKGINPISNIPVSYKLNSNSTVQETVVNTLSPGDSLLYEFTNTLTLTSGATYKLLLVAKMPQDANYLNDSLVVDFTTGGTPASAVTQDFQSTVFPPADWVLTNVDGSTTWVRSPSIPGALGTNTYAAKMNNFIYSGNGSRDILTSPLIDLSPVGQPALIFDRAYAPRSSRRDSLYIRVSSDCGNTFLPVGYAKGYAQLATVPAKTVAFTPINASQWKSDTVNLAAFAGSKILIQFISVGRFGNVLYLDNIRTTTLITSINEKTQASQLRVFPNPATTWLQVEMPETLTSTGYTLVGVDGRIVGEGKLNGEQSTLHPVNIDQLTPGVYSILVRDGNHFWRGRFLKQ